MLNMWVYDMLGPIQTNAMRLRCSHRLPLPAACCVSGGSGWPSNTLLYVGASATSTVSRSDPLVARCPLVVALPGIDTQEQYWQVRVQPGGWVRGGGGGGSGLGAWVGSRKEEGV
jgi:hypothetical protein